MQHIQECDVWRSGFQQQIHIRYMQPIQECDVWRSGFQQQIKKLKQKGVHACTCIHISLDMVGLPQQFTTRQIDQQGWHAATVYIGVNGCTEWLLFLTYHNIQCGPNVTSRRSYWHNDVFVTSWCSFWRHDELVDVMRYILTSWHPQLMVALSGYDLWHTMSHQYLFQMCWRLYFQHTTS